MSINFINFTLRLYGKTNHSQKIAAGPNSAKQYRIVATVVPTVSYSHSATKIPLFFPLHNVLLDIMLMQSKQANKL